MKIVMAEHTHFESLYRVGCHHIAEYLVGEGHEVMYLSGPMNPFNLRYFITGNPSVVELRYGLKTWIAGGLSPRAGLRSYVPLTLLPIWRRGPFASAWMARHPLDGVVPSIRHVLGRTGFAHPDVLMVSQLFFAGLLARVAARAKVLRLTDDIEQFPGMPHSVRTLEREGVACADAVIVTSSPLVAKMKRMGVEQPHYVANGVDFNSYQSPRAKPPELEGQDGPVVIYMGALDSWFDTSLVAAAARAMPSARFLLIGAPRCDLRVISHLSNVRLLGPRPYADLPAFLQHATVGIIPFRVTALIESVSPLKLYEYMACGLPVVSTRWRELEQIDSPARLVNSESEFVDGLREAMAERGSRADEYRAFASANSWKKRGQAIERLFENLLVSR